MSQQMLLADVSSWGPDKCRTQLNSALPQLVDCLGHAGTLQKETEIIQLICRSFLPVVPPKYAENLLFSKVVHKTAECVDAGLGEAEEMAIKVMSEGTLQTIIQLIQHCVDLIGCLTSFVRHLTQEDGDLEMTSVHSLPASILHVIERSYSHCKESAQTYGDLLGSLSQQLSMLFRHANNLQTAFVGLLDRVRLTVGCGEQDAQDMVTGTLRLLGAHLWINRDTCGVVMLSRVSPLTAIHGLFAVSQVAAGLEVKVMCALWKAISRLSCQHKQTVGSQLDLDQMVMWLATDMSATYTYMFALPNSQEDDSKNYIKTCKVLGFQMRVLQMFMKEFSGHLELGIHSVYQLILVLQSYVSPCFSALSCPARLSAEVERHVTVGVAALIRALVPCRRFALCVTRQQQDIDDIERLPWLLTVLAVLGNLASFSDDVQVLWLQPEVCEGNETTSSLLRTLGAAISLCPAELSAPVTLPGVPAEGKPQRVVSLYEAVLTAVSGLLACTQAHHFHAVEAALLDLVLGRQHLPAMLAIDTWCFLARYGSADLCRDHCLLVAFLLHQGAFSAAPQCCHLVLLLRRLLRFMAPEHQADFVSAFPVASHGDLWCVLPLTVLTLALQPPVVQQLITMATRHIDGWLSALQHTTAATKHLVTGLRMLQNVFTSEGVAEHVSEQLRAEVVTQCGRVWETLPQDQVGVYPPLLAATTAIYRLSAALAPYLDEKAMLQIVMTSSGLLSHDLDMETKLTILHFLASMTKMRFSPSQEERATVGLATLYRKLLLDAAVVVHQVALETFSQFAEETPHEGAVSATLQAWPRLKTAVIAHLNQELPEDLALPVEQLQQDGRHLLHMAGAAARSLYPAPVWPSAELGMQTTYMTSLADLRHGVMSLAAVGRPLPDWLREELRAVHTELALLL